MRIPMNWSTLGWEVAKKKAHQEKKKKRKKEKTSFLASGRSPLA
jgi:hypothetical protein